MTNKIKATNLKFNSNYFVHNIDQRFFVEIDNDSNKIIKIKNLSSNNLLKYVNKKPYDRTFNYRLYPNLLSNIEPIFGLHFYLMKFLSIHSE